MAVDNFLIKSAETFRKNNFSKKLSEFCVIQLKHINPHPFYLRVKCP